MQSLSKSEVIEFLNLIVEKSNLVMERDRSLERCVCFTEYYFP